MPKFDARLRLDLDGSWVASALEFPNCWSRGRTQEEALAKLRGEIRYRIEFCPCSSVGENYVQVELKQGSEPPAPATPRPPARWGPGRQATPTPLTGIAGCPPSEPHPPAEPKAAKPAPGWRRWED